MPRGGRRPGAGAKPGAKRRALLTPRQLAPHKVVRGAFGLPEPPVASPAAADEMIAPPADMEGGELAAWRALAPHAVAERTLTVSRVAGFRVLCQRWVYCAELDARIRVLGIVSGEADRLLKRLEAWQKLLGASLGEFNLRSFGKPAVAEKPKAASNPWASLTSKA